MKQATVAGGNRRLLKLAKLLRKVKKERFNYTHWVGEDWKGAANLSCGTTACALGWATTMPSLRRLGLRLVKTCHWGNEVRLGRLANTTAAQVLFNLDYHDADYLFIPKDYEINATPKLVARKIERFVTSRSK